MKNLIDKLLKKNKNYMTEKMKKIDKMRHYAHKTKKAHIANKMINAERVAKTTRVIVKK